MVARVTLDHLVQVRVLTGQLKTPSFSIGSEGVLYFGFLNSQRNRTVAFLVPGTFVFPPG